MTFFHARHEDKLAALLHLLHHVIKSDQKVVIFVATKHHVELLRLVLSRHGYDPCYIYSSLDPMARKMMIQRFRHEDEDPDKVSNLMIRVAKPTRMICETSTIVLDVQNVRTGAL